MSELADFLKELLVALVWLLAILLTMVTPVPFPYRWAPIFVVFAAAIYDLYRYVGKQ